MKLKKTEKVVIAGQTGSGKTELAKYIAKQYAKAGYDVWFIDPHREVRLKNCTMFYPHEYAATLRIFSRAFNEGNKVLVIDEAQNYFRRIPAPLSGIQAKIVNQGRHKGLALIFVTPRVQQLHSDVLAQASTYFLFRMVFPRDLEYLSDFVGEAAFLLPKLRPYWFLVVKSDGSIRIHKPISLNT
ncbi:MAG: AAA family ATPase [Nitrososphaerota archaeon]